jgi:hypothetical protein
LIPCAFCALYMYILYSIWTKLHICMGIPYITTCGIREGGGKGAQGLKQQSPTTILSLILLFSSCLSSLRKSLIHCLFQFGSQLLYVEDLPFGIIFQNKPQVYLKAFHKTSIILLYMYDVGTYSLCQENY